MARDSRYDILFEPVKIGPVTAGNRVNPGAVRQQHGQRPTAYSGRAAHYSN